MARRWGPDLPGPPYPAAWNTRGTPVLLVGVVKIIVPVTITAGTGWTRRLSVGCPGCTWGDMESEDLVQTAPGAAAATYTFSAPAHYLAQMAAFKAVAPPVYVQGATAASNTGGATIAQAFASPITAGNLVVVTVAWQGTAALTVTDSVGNGYAVATSTYDAVNGQSLAILYAPNVTGGAATVTASFASGVPTVRRLEIHEYAGLATTSPLDATAMNIGDGTTTLTTTYQWSSYGDLLEVERRAAECAFEGDRIDVVDIQIKSRIVNHTVIFLKTCGNSQHQS